MDPNLPTQNNVNVTIAISVLVWLLSVFHIVIPPDIAAAVVKWLPIVTAVIVGLLHNVVNKPAVAARAKAFARECATRTLDNKRIIAPVLLAILFVPTILLGGCAGGTNIFGSGYAQATHDLGDAELATAGLMNGLIATCKIGTVGAIGVPSQCADANFRANAKRVSAAVASASTVAVTLAKNPNADVASIETDVGALVTAYLNFQTASAPAASAKKKLDIPTTINIAESVISVALEVYQQIQSLNASAGGGALTADQLTSLDSGVQAANATIQSW